MGLIPGDSIEEVRLRSDIVEVVSRYVQLKKKGKNYTGSCPFHSERTPSFTVTPDKQIFHCFGCKAGGDVFKFLMLKENLTFSEAVEMLAERAGIVLPEDESPGRRERVRQEAGLREINSLARDFFRQVLQHHHEAAAARAYLAGRGLTPEVLERFQVGFAPSGWDSLLAYLAQRGHRPEKAVEAGLALKSQAGKYYDRFRSRVIFPIWDAVGRVIAFGGRVLDGSLPKYLNTPETAVFSKGRVLYGLHLARSAIREKGCAVIVEGYMDVITAHQHGATNTVASLGTALTAEQGKLLMNYSRNAVIAYDADAAGEAAARRGLDLLQELGCQVRVATLPEGKDPDELLRGQGSGAWEKMVGQAPSLVEYKLLQATAAKPALTVGEKLEILRRVLPDLVTKNGVEKEEGLRSVARALHLSWETVSGEFKRIEANKGKKWTIPDNTAKTKHTILGKEERQDARAKAESVLLGLVLEDPSLGAEIVEKLGENPFKNPHYLKIFNCCLELAHRPTYRVTDIYNLLEDDEQNILSMLLAQEIPGENPIQIIKDYTASIARCARKERMKELLIEIGRAQTFSDSRSPEGLLRELSILKGIEEAERAGDQNRLNNLIREHQQLSKPDNWKHPSEGSDDR